MLARYHRYAWPIFKRYAWPRITDIYIILEQDENITETQKYGMPCFCYKKKMFCYLWTDKKTDEPYILMVEGKYLDHPQLEQGDRSRMKIFRVNSIKDLPIKAIKSILQEALDLYRNGIIEIKS